jgi:hypothetical protein
VVVADWGGGQIRDGTEGHACTAWSLDVLENHHPTDPSGTLAVAARVVVWLIATGTRMLLQAPALERGFSLPRLSLGGW